MGARVRYVVGKVTFAFRFGLVLKESTWELLSHTERRPGEDLGAKPDVKLRVHFLLQVFPTLRGQCGSAGLGTSGFTLGILAISSLTSNDQLTLISNILTGKKWSWTINHYGYLRLWNSRASRKQTFAIVELLLKRLMNITWVSQQSEDATKSAKLKRLEINIVILSGIVIVYKQIQRHQVVQVYKNAT